VNIGFPYLIFAYGWQWSILQERTACHGDNVLAGSLPKGGQRSFYELSVGYVIGPNALFGKQQPLKVKHGHNAAVGRDAGRVWHEILVGLATGLGHDVDQEFVSHPDHAGFVVSLFGVNGKWCATSPDAGRYLGE